MFGFYKRDRYYDNCDLRTSLKFLGDATKDRKSLKTNYIKKIIIISERGGKE
jgi:hypothetical protein